MGSGGYGTFGAPLGLLTDDRAKAIYGAYSSRKGMSEVVAAATVALADRLGADAYDLANLINFESGWNPAAVNPTSGASGLIQFMPKCLTEDTLALTPRGWKRHDELQAGDEILSYNSATRMLELDRVKAVHVYRVDKAVRMWNKQFDFIATPNHRWYCRYLTREVVKTTEELAGQKSLYKIIRAAPMTSTAPPPVAAEVAWWELIGVIVGDGSIDRKKSRVRIYQSPTAKPQVCQHIDGLIAATGLRPSQSERGGMRRWDFTGEQARRLLAAFRTDSDLKRLDLPQIMGLHRDNLQALQRGYLITDGHTYHRKGNDRVQFKQTERAVMDDFQIISLLLGQVCNVRVQARGGVIQKFPGGHESIIRNAHYTYLKVNAPVTEARANRMNYAVVEGPLTVWCPETFNQTWVAKRDGFVTITGNTAANLGTTVEAVRQMTALEQLALAERYFAPHRGRVGTVQGLYMAVFYPKAMSWSLDTQMPEIVRKANPGINTVGDYVRLANRRARLPSSDSRGGRALESAVALAPLVSAGAAARIGGVATQGRDLAIDYRMPLLALGALGFLGVAIVAFRVWRRHKP